MNLFRAAIGVIVLVAAFAFSGGCSGRKFEVSGEWKDDRGALRQWVRRSGRSYSCYFVTITGQGISPDYGPGDLGSRDPICMGLGINSKSLSLSTIENAGVKFKIPGGPKRKIRVIGVRTTLTDCAGLTVKELFDRRPGFYELGVGEEDAFADKRVTVRESADVANAADLVAPCDNKETPTLPKTASGQRLVAVLSGAPDVKVRVFDQDVDLSLTRFQLDFTLPVGSPNKLVATHNYRSVFATRDSNSSFFYRRLNVDDQGSFVSDPITHQAFLPNRGAGLAFSSADDSAYVWQGVDSFYRYGTATTQLAPKDPLSCGFSLLTGFFSIGSFSYLAVGNQINVVTIGAEGGPCYAFSAVFSVNGNFLRHREGANGIHYIMGESSNLVLVRAYTRNSTHGGFSELGGPVSFTGTIGDFALSKDAKYLFVADPYAGRILTFNVLGNGEISPIPRILDSVGNPRSIGVSYDGKVLYFITSVGQVARYEIDSGGGLLALPASAETENMGDYLDLLPVPIF